jgi:hypothetical protein
MGRIDNDRRGRDSVNIKTTFSNQIIVFLLLQGFVVNEKLKDICQHTSDKDLRLYLVSVLMSQSTWTQEESTMVDYLNQVEAVYGTELASAQQRYPFGLLSSLIKHLTDGDFCTHGQYTEIAQNI